MTTVQLSTFLPLVLPYAQTCPHISAEQNLRLAAIEFCERTKLWRHTIKGTPIAANNEAVAAPDYATIFKITKAEWVKDGQRTLLTPAQFDDLDFDEMDDSANQGCPAYISQIEPNTVAISPYAEGALNLSLILSPRSGSLYGRVPHDPMQDYYNQVPEWMFTNHAEVIAHGALGRILKTPRQDYTDLSLATYFERSADAKMAALSARGVQGQQRARLRSRPQWM